MLSSTIPYNIFQLNSIINLINWDPLNVGPNIALTNNNRTATKLNSGYESVVSVTPHHSSEAVAFETKYDVRIGGSFDFLIGIIDEANKTAELTAGGGSVGGIESHLLDETARIRHDGTVSSPLGSALSPIDVIMVTLVDDILSFYINGTYLASTVVAITDYVAELSLFNAGSTVNFGNAPFVAALPIGFTSWDGSQTTINNSTILDALYTHPSVVLSNNDKTITSSIPSEWRSSYSVDTHSTTKNYFEATLDVGSWIGVGISLIKSMSDHVGSAIGGISYITGNANIHTDDNLIDTLLTTSIGDTVGVLYDGTASTATYVINGIMSIPYAMPIGTYFAGLSAFSSGGSGTINLGDSEFVYSFPSEFTSWDGTQVGLDHFDKFFSNATLTNNNTTATSSVTWNTAIGVTSVSTGKYYFEVTYDVVAVDQFGFGITSNKVIGGGDGVVPADLILFLRGTNGSTLEWWSGSVGVAITAPPITALAGDTFGVGWDADTGQIDFYDASGILLLSYTDVARIGVPHFLSVAMKGGQVTTTNFGQSAFAHAIPGGYTSWDESQLGVSPISVVGIRLVVDAINGGLHANMLELIIRDTAGNILTDVASGGTSFQNSTQISGVTDANRLFDGIVTGDLYAGGVNGSQIGWTVGKLLGTPFVGDLGTYDIVSRSHATVGATTPIAWHIETSLDTTTGLDGNWTVVDTITGEAPWSANESRTFTINALPSVLDSSTAGTGFVLSNGELTGLNSAGSWQSALSTNGKATGQLYTEMTVDAIGIAVGISLSASKASAATTFAGGTTPGYSWHADGSLFINGGGVGTGQTFTVGDVVALAVDLDLGTVAAYKNGVNLLNSNITTSTTYFSGLSSIGGGQGTMNYGASAFSTAPPIGFVAWDN